MRRLACSLVLACAALLGVGLFGAVLPPGSDAQVPPRFAYDILPGVQAPSAETAASFAPIDVIMTQGWHYESYPHAIDINTSGVGDPVFVAVRSLEHSPQISAILSWDETVSGCSYISVRFVLDLGFAAEDLGEIRYLHVGPSPTLVDGERMPLASAPNGVAVSKAGTLLQAAWIPVEGGSRRDNVWSPKIDEAIDDLVADGTLVEVARSKVGTAEWITVDGKRFRVRMILGAWYEQRWREAFGEAPPDLSDGAGCASTGPHVHQVEGRGQNLLWRNLDRAATPDDDGLGFHVELRSNREFCSDVWIFRLQSSVAAPDASPVESCAAPRSAPSNLRASPQNGRLVLDWADPSDPTITGYKYRVRLASATSADSAPWGDGWTAAPGSGALTTSVPLGGLVNGMAYTVQLRAVNGNGDGPISSVTATPTDPTAPPTLDEVSISGTTLTATFEWGGTSPRSVWWELHRSTGQTSGFARVQGPTADSSSPLTFENLARGYWYQVRGRTCESPSSLPDSRSGRSARSPSYVATSCGDWTNFSTPVLVPTDGGTTTLPLICTPPKVPNDAGTACVDPPLICTAPQVPNDAGTACVDPPLVCTAPQIPNEAGTACVDPPLVCTAPQVPNDAGTACVDPPLICTAPQVPNDAGTACVDPPLICTAPQVPNDAGTACVDPPLICTAPQVPNDAGTACVDPPLVCMAPQIPNDAGTSCVDPPPPPPCDGKLRPVDFSIGPIVNTSTATRWITTFVSPSFCVQYEEQQTTTTTTVVRTTYSCDGECYVAAVTQNVSTSTGPWRRTGGSRTCNFTRSDTSGEYTLSAGTYELQLGEQRIRFTVPVGSQVVLSWRETANGTPEVVLRSGTERVVIGADALSGAGQDRLGRFADASKSPLSSVVSSLRAPATGDTVATSSTTTPCIEIEAGENGASAVDLDVNGCAMLRYGGAVTVTSGGHSRTFTLSADREWLAVEASLYEPRRSGAVTFVDAFSGGYITLALSDGSELSRHIPEGNSELAALFDAMRTTTPP